jgi:hypothetical protein
MKNSVFKKFAFVAMVFISVCAFGAVMDSGLAACSLEYCLPDISVSDISYVGFAVAAVAIPACNFENLKVITQAEFSTLQAKFGKLYVLEVSIDDDETYQFILRRPTRQHLELVESYKNDTGKANDVIIKNLVVAGDIKILDDGIVYSRFMAEAAKIITQGSAFLSRA